MDAVIRDGLIVDGSGGPSFSSDVWVDRGRIAKVGKDPGLRADKTISAKGLVVSPGFIDIHTHSDFGLFWDPIMERKLRQGVTTEVIGNCGDSAAPLTNEHMEDIMGYYSGNLFGIDRVDFNWRSMAEYLSVLEKRGIGINEATLVGHTMIRLCVLGFENRAPSREEMEQMKQLVRESMRGGAFGISTGLFEIAPANYATTAEITELCRAVAELGGMHACHMRGYPSPDEVIAIARSSAVKTHIAHYGSIDPESIEKLQVARNAGFDITFDLYPYNAGMVQITYLLPESLQEGGVDRMIQRLRDPKVRDAVKNRDPSIEWTLGKDLKWEDVLIAYTETDKSLQGKTVAEIANARSSDPIDVIFDLYEHERGRAMTIVFGYGRTDESVTRALRHPRSTVGSDSSEPPFDRHPRAYGTHARILKYVREMGVVPLEEAVRKMTSFPAQILGVEDRGLIGEGMWADIAIFDPNEIADRSTYKEPDAFATGVKTVMVNGQVVLEDGEPTRALVGQVLRFSSKTA